MDPGSYDASTAERAAIELRAVKFLGQDVLARLRCTCRANANASVAAYRARFHQLHATESAVFDQQLEIWEAELEAADLEARRRRQERREADSGLTFPTSSRGSSFEAAYDSSEEDSDYYLR